MNKRRLELECVGLFSPYQCQTRAWRRTHCWSCGKPFDLSYYRIIVAPGRFCTRACLSRFIGVATQREFVERLR